MSLFLEVLVREDKAGGVQFESKSREHQWEVGNVHMGAAVHGLQHFEILRPKTIPLITFTQEFKKKACSGARYATDVKVLVSSFRS